MGDHEAGFFLSPNSSDRTAIVQELTERLQGVDHQGSPLFREVGRPERFIGPVRDGERIPDLIAISREEVGISQGLGGGSVFVTEPKPRRGVHERQGVLVVGGEQPPVREDAAVEDITPTILSLLNVRPPEWMQGACLLDAAPIKSVGHVAPSGDAEGAALSPEEESAIQDHLRGLGYVE
jgi:predicted AlkP superfamily phosphohydrolase/phosphomutase